ncbi:MAG TPA: YoaK family protein [Xanthobacteraceae bacterium]|jgi:uncharacterized membrane protein YoaK (UPF0700 family)|nr:YoaK family protein [Xanthobacteraceae bacterium]
MSELFLPLRRRVPAIVPLLLSFTAGFIDSFTVLALFGLFVAQVTGSFVLMAVAFVKDEQGALIKTLAVPVFLLAGVATTVFAVVLERRGRPALPWILGLECAVLTGFLLTMLIGAPLSEPGALSVAMASLLGLFAMGTQSAAVRLLMKDVASTNVMTTNTTNLAVDAAELVLAWQARRRAPADATLVAAYEKARARFRGVLPIMLGFLAGTVIGMLAYVAIGVWGLLLPLAIMYAIFAWTSASALRAELE